jgi:hypothetical protein
MPSITTPITTPVARFKTANTPAMQRQLVFNADVLVSGTTAGTDIIFDNTGYLPVGTVVAMTQVPTQANGFIARFTAATVAQLAGDLTGFFIIAQSDATMSNGHVPVETLSYRYIRENEFVAVTTNNPVNPSLTAKVVTVFRITDPTDVVVAAR